MKKILLLITTVAAVLVANAQTQSQKQTLLLTVNPLGNGDISLNWTARSFSGNYQIFKRTSDAQAWPGSATAVLTNSANTWTDTSFSTGKSAEYVVYQVNSSNQLVAVGYAFAGNKTKEIPSFGAIVLLVDSNFIKPLATELANLKKDLESNGWLVYNLYAGRNEKVSTVRNRIIAFNNAAVIKPRSLYIIGHVPVPYSGSFRNIDSATACAYPPDGHIEGSGNHTGAWPADVLYGDLGGTYSDVSAVCKTGPSRMWNVAGDGKYDQCKVAQEVELEIGRVDMFNMPVFAKSDTVLVRNYLNRAHLWRIDSIAVIERGLVDDNFTSYSLAAGGWLTQSSMIRQDSIFGNRDYFTAQNKGSYLWSHGCGAGSYTNCSGIGASSNFNPGIYNNIFTSLSGSFFGDWDVQNNFLRAPLGAGSLASFWGGIPTWYNHYMALGMPIGHGARYTQNMKTQDFNGSENGVYINLMGDPTSKVRNVPPPGKLKVTNASNKAQLSWRKATGKFDGYVVYKIDSATNTWTRLNANILTDTFYNDATTLAAGKHKFAVRTIRLETNPSGSWYNLGGGSFGWMQSNLSIPNFEPVSIKIYPNPTTGNITLQVNELNPGIAHITVMDIAGKTVFETKTSALSGVIHMQLPAGLNGNYLIRCEINGRIGVNKVIVNP